MAGEWLNDEVLDQGLDWIIAQNPCRLDITSQAATSYGEATTDGTYSLGNETAITVGATEDDGTGRKVVVPAITDGDVTETGDASHWALTDSSAVLIATGPLTGGGQSVTDGNKFTLDAIDVTHAAATIT